MSSTSPLALIVAMSENRVIGVNNALPWHLPADLAFFKKTTLGHPVLMGRKTYQSIGRCLPGRPNLILSRDPNFKVLGADTFTSLNQALNHPQQGSKVFIIGGADLFEQCLPLAAELFITTVHATLEGDTYFPSFPEKDWQLVSSTDHAADECNAYAMTFSHWRRSSTTF